MCVYTPAAFRTDSEIDTGTITTITSTYTHKLPVNELQLAFRSFLHPILTHPLNNHPPCNALDPIIFFFDFSPYTFDPLPYP